MSQIASPLGKVYLVGAGPGDPGLLTLRARKVLARADVVLYDYLVNPIVVQQAPAAAETICLGIHGQTRIWTQSEVNARLVQLATAGKTVVRLKGGDPTIFGRLYQETAALAAHGIEYEIVPGVSAAIAAADTAEVPLTHRDHASAVAFVTGKERADQAGSNLDYRSLAGFPGTLVYFMGVTSAEYWVGELLANGKSPATPVVLVRRASLPDQRTIRCTLSEVPDLVTPHQRFAPPALAIVGGGAAASPTQSWFESRPLFGQTILVTRPVGQQAALSSRLEELGARVLQQPAIEIRDVPFSTDALPSFADAAADSDHWLLFTSANGVDAFFRPLFATGSDVRVLGRAKIGAVGAATARSLRSYFVNPDFVPSRASGQTMVAELIREKSVARVLWIRGSRVASSLRASLISAGIAVDELVVYESTDVPSADESICRAIREGQIDIVTVTSGAIAHALVGMFGETLRQTKLVSLSPGTSDAMRAAGYPPSSEAAEPTDASLVDAVLRASHDPLK